jgi:transcriptional regulator with XRE-family HTH domain
MADTNPIRAKRKKLGLSQADLAARLKVDQATISRAETSDDPDPRYVLALDGLIAASFLAEHAATPEQRAA